MLHRITAIWLLCAGLLFAGVPAIACCEATVPTQDCCPHGPPVGQFLAGLAPTAAACCGTVPMETGASGATAATPEIRKHPPHPDPLTLIAWLVLSTSEHLSPSPDVGST